MADVPAHIDRDFPNVETAIMVVELWPVWHERQRMNAFLMMAILFLPALAGRGLRAPVLPAFPASAV